MLTQKYTRGGVYVLWFLFGALGLHRFYLRRMRSGLAMLVIVASGYMFDAASLDTPAIIAGVIFLAWWVADAFWIPTMVEEENIKARQSPDRSSES